MCCALALTAASVLPANANDYSAQFTETELALPGRGYGADARRTPLAQIDYRQGRFSAGVEFGVVSESGAVLGAPWPGALALETRTQFLGFSSGVTLTRDVQARLHTEIGATRFDGQPSGASSPAEILNTSGSASLRWSGAPVVLNGLLPRAQASLTLSVSQPLRVESAAFAPLLPVASGWAQQSLSLLPRAISAAPSGREIDASATYSLFTADDFSARLSAIYAHEPRHDRNAPPEKAVTIGFHYRF